MKTAEVKNIIEGIIDSFQGAILTNRQADAINDAREFLAASYPPAAPVSGDELTEFLEAVTNERNEFCGFINSLLCDSGLRTKCESLLIIYDQMRERLSATLPTREQRGEKEKFAIRFSEWLMIQCEYKNHCVWEYRGEEYTQNELIEIFKRTTPLPSPPKH